MIKFLYCPIFGLVSVVIEPPEWEYLCTTEHYEAVQEAIREHTSCIEAAIMYSPV